MNMHDDADITETGEWLDALKAVQAHRGVARTQFLLGKLREEALRTNSMPPFLPTTPYRNTIPPDQEVKAPGDRAIEHRLRSPSGWVAGIRTHSERLGDRPRCGNRRTIQWVAYPLALR